MALNEHVPPGALMAYVESGRGETERLPGHLQACEFCGEMLEALSPTAEPNCLAEKIPDAVYKETRCPETPDAMARFLMKFMRSGVPGETLLPFFRHMNDCYDCFELFIINWSAYCDQKKSAALDRDEEDRNGAN